ncbi:MAG TPA: chemotaxis protein CheB [Gammaproteobacteria bacterium]
MVGVGASAGGLAAFSKLLENVPTDPGLAFVIIQHLSPDTKSSLSEILASKTGMPVTEVKEDTAVAAGHIYVLPPNKNIVIEHNTLKLSSREHIGLNLPIDIFFTSLAKYKQSNAVGVILSGNGSDGTIGMKAIRDAGGITFAQDKTAEFSGMPQSAISAGVAAYICSPTSMATKLVSIARNLPLRDIEGNVQDESGDLSTLEEQGFHHILKLLLAVSDVDFTYYKPGTIRRRIMRRVLLNNLQNFQEYSRCLEQNPQELELLYQDLLIKVTDFFRDQDMFGFLKLRILPELFKNTSHSVRIWVPGCATGEEVYSFAISLADYMAENKQDMPVQIFGTDISEAALNVARRAKYSKSIEASVPPKLLEKFFHALPDGGYEISKNIRTMCVFAKHNMITDTPFSKMDIVSCRNVLIYLDSRLQKRVFPLFHYALNPKGFLVLGTAETAANFQDLFAKIDNSQKIYLKKSAVSRPGLDFAVPNPPRIKNDKAAPQAEPRLNLEQRANSIILSRHAPAGIIIDDDLMIVQFRGDISPYLKPTPGRATLDLVRMTHKGLLTKILENIAKARRSGAAVKSTHTGIRLTVEVIPPGLSGERHYLILFETANSSRAKNGVSKKTKQEREGKQEEIDSTVDQLQILLEERNTANEELRSAHEELMSSNEELQSTNEELETTKEELQSTNEELMTLNAELQRRNVELKKIETAHIEMTPQFKLRGDELYRKNEFISILAHELRNPLAPIVHALEIAKFRGVDDPEINHLMGIIGRQVAALNNILANLLDAARAMRGRIQIHLEPVDFRAVVDHAIETTRRTVELNRHTLELHLPEPPLRMLLDPLRVEQIIVNLLNNATKYTEPGGKITIAVTQTSETVLLSVKDTGAGIAEEMLLQIFDSFTHGDKSLGQFKGGLGVGLMLAKTLAELHGGSLVGSSPGLGQGSEFILQLPSRKNSYSANPGDLDITPKISGLKRQTFRKRRVMVVDDNAVLADTFGQLLRVLNQDVTVMYNGASVVEAVRADNPDLIFLDIAMPSISGYKLVKILRKESDLKKTKLIALSGFGEEYRDRSKEAGFDDHLIKPVGLPELERILAE